MSAIRLFTDEDIYAAIAVALRRVGFDAISTPESGRLGESDESQLDWATAEARVLVTFNVSDFTRLHSVVCCNAADITPVLSCQARDPLATP
jgi:hypothetical protein